MSELERVATDVRMILDMLAHRLRDDGPPMDRQYVRRRVKEAAEKLNSIVPCSPLRDEAT